ncbi:hypothetical protein, partial [Prevotella sp.]
FSETQNGKDVKYKIVDIKSLEVDNALQDGKKRTFILIDEDPTFQYLATVIYKGKHVTGYMQPFAFENSTHSRSFTGIWTNNTVYLGCRSYDYKVDGGKLVYYWMLFEDKKINSKREKYSQKKLLKKIKNKFKDYPAVAEEVEKRGLTAEQIHEDPTILLEILDKSLQ